MIETMKLALEALERYSGVDQRACDAEDALRDAIAEAESVEPVAFFDPQERGFYWARPMRFSGVPVTVRVEPISLYTTPPAAQWVGLTPHERMMCRSYDADETVAKTEAKLKEKNHG